MMHDIMRRQHNLTYQLSHLPNHDLLFDKLQNMYGIPYCLVKWFGLLIKLSSDNTIQPTHISLEGTQQCYAPMFLAWSSFIPSTQ